MRELARKSGLKSHSLVGESRKGMAGPDAKIAAKWADILGVEDVPEWMAAAAVVRSATTSTGKGGAAVLSARVSELERELADTIKDRDRLSAILGKITAELRKRGIKVPDACS